MGNAVEGWLQEENARTLFAAAGFDLDRLRASAEQRDFKPVDLHIKAQVNIQNQVRQVEQFNVLGMVPGTDPKLATEAVIYSAHWDHLGMEKLLTAKPISGTVRWIMLLAAQPCWQWRRQQSGNRQSARRYFCGLVQKNSIYWAARVTSAIHPGRWQKRRQT
jgi:hypothetical protein